MALIVILIVLGLQRFLKFGSRSYQFAWIDCYYQWMAKKISWVTKGHGLVATLVLVMPMLVAVSLVFAVFYHLLGSLGYAILGVAMLWYCLDARDLVKEPHDIKHPDQLLMFNYQHVFSGLFWFFVFGPVGIALSITVAELNQFAAKNLDEDRQSLKQFLALTQGVLDWVPMRLVGIGFALVGDFGAVFKNWWQQSRKGIQTNQEQVAEWGLLALKASGSEDDQSSATLEAVIGLLDRTLLVWLVVIAIITIA